MGNVASQHYDGTRDSPRVDDTLVFARNISETRGILSNASARDGVSSARASVSPRATPVMCVRTASFETFTRLAPRDVS